MSSLPYQPDILIHPGETLQENLEALGISQKDLAMRVGLTEKHISQIINGKAPISPETALKLERVIGGSASFWNSLEKNHRETLARRDAEERLPSEVEMVKKYTCYSELVEHEYVPATRSWT